MTDLRNLLADIDQHLTEIRQDLKAALASAHGIVHRHTPAKDAAPEEGEPGCASCARIGQHMPRGKGTGDLCLWCWKHRAWRHPQAKGPEMPARQIVAAYHTNGRVTTKDARDAGITT